MIKTICTIIFASIRFPFLDGRKYNYSKSEQRKLREVSDRICREHGLSVIENPHKAPSRQVWLDEKSGKPTRYNVYREDVKEAINFSRRPYYMEEYLRRKGYITDFTGKHWKIRLPQYEHFTRLDTLDETDGRPNISKGQWALTLPSETAGQQSPIRPKCRRACGTGSSHFKRQAISTGCICTTAIC